MEGKNYIRFDWAMKRLLRNKANHAVLEGLMESLLNQKITIKRFLESEANQDSEDDKFNRVDILCEDEKNNLIIIEIQNNRELYYFHRMLYGVSKAITDYIDLGNDYDKVRKVYSINIVYFGLGQGGDYVYHGTTEFRGYHNPEDILRLSARQHEVFFGQKQPTKREERRKAGEVFPEYYILKVNDFDNIATTRLDEWMEFLKTGQIAADATAPGLAEARQCLDLDKMTAAERRAYINHMEALRYQRSVIGTGYDDGWQEGLVEGMEKGMAEGMEKGRAEGIEEGMTKGIEKTKAEMLKNMFAKGLSVHDIADLTGMPAEEVEKFK